MLAKQEKGDRFWHYVCQKCGAEYSKTREEWEEEPPPPRPRERIPPSDLRTEMTVKIELPTTKELRRWLVEEAGGWQAYASEVRTYGGMIFQPSEETKGLWDKIRRTAEESALLQAAQKWLEALAKDSERIGREYLVRCSFEKDSPAEQWRQILLQDPEGLKLTAPELVERSDPASSPWCLTLVMGRIFQEGGAFGKLKIQIVTSGQSPYGIRSTVLHETLHWLDWYAQMPWYGNHDSLWKVRLRKFEKMFPPY
jgi:hypothetical protein